MQNGTPETSAAVREDFAAQRLIHAIDAIVIMVEADGVIADCNGTCEALSGYPASELLGRNVASALAAADEATLIKSHVARIAAGDEVGRFDSFLLTSAGTRRRVRWNGARLNSAQCPSPILLTAIDVTSEYEAIAQATALSEVNTELQDNLTRICAQYDIDLSQAAERRRDERHNFRQHQRIAAIQNNRMPAEHAFFKVECRDIGAQGIGFCLDAPPSSATYLVELGWGRDAIYLTASVQHATLDQQSGLYCVGCTFTGRLSLTA